MEKLRSKYKGWKVRTLKNNWLTLHIAPQLGGRIMQVEMDGYEYLFNNPLLAGFEPDSTRLGEDGSWLNFGGEKVWPAPQGWNSSDEWPGPPDPVIDSGIYTEEEENSNLNNIYSYTLKSPIDPYTGLQITRNIGLADDGSRVDISVSFCNRSDIPRRWSVWPVCQINTGGSDRNGQHQVVCPVNHESMYKSGYKVMHGLVNNPQYDTDENGNLTVTYNYLVGKVGLDSKAGWVAYVNRNTGKVFVMRFSYEVGNPYPENTSVQIWTQGRGLIFSRNKIVEYKDDPCKNPAYLELELLSPFNEILPGCESRFEYQICTCEIPENSGIRTVGRYGIVSSPLKMEKTNDGILFSAKYGFFTEGILKIQLKGSREDSVVNPLLLQEMKVSPFKGVDFGLIMKRTDKWPDREMFCTAELFNRDGHFLWEMDKINNIRYE